MNYASGGGIISADNLYVERKLDAELVRTLDKRRAVVAISAPRQSGKSSLVDRLLHQLQQGGHRTAYIDIRIAIGAPQDANKKPADWFRLLFEAIAGELGLDSGQVSKWMVSRQTIPWAKQFIDFLSTFCRSEAPEPITIALDELDFISKFVGNHTDHLFEAVRALHTQRDLDVSVILASVNHPSEHLKALSPATFNVFVGHQLRDFESDEDTIRHWTAALPWEDDVRREVGHEVLRQTGGQPYLTSVLFQRALETESKTSGAIETLAQKIAVETDDVQLRSHFSAPEDIILHEQGRAWEALELYKKALSEPVPTFGSRRPVVNLLVNSGLVREQGARLEVKSPIYEKAFDQEWVERTKSRIGLLSHTSRVPKFISTERKPTICVINTGGLISMELKDDGHIDAPYDLQEFFADFPEMNDIAHIDTLALMCKDSSNMAPADWKAVAESIYQRKIRDYRGFVVCHGTDTLAYTASAVAFALGPGLRVPVVFTAAQIPRHYVYGDARINILRACKVATLEIPEVVVAIGDHVYRAVRAEKKDDYRFDSFHSPTMPPLATIAQDIELQRHLIRQPDRSRGMECQADFSDGVFKISFYPGLNPKFLEPIINSDQMRGLIIETPGVGIVPTEADFSLLTLIAHATEKTIPVLLVSQYPIQAQISKVYQLAEIPIQAGAIPAVNMSAPAAVTKFMWVLRK